MAERRRPLLVTVLVIALLAACGSSKAPARPPVTLRPTTTTTSTTLAKTLDPAFLTRERGVLTVATDHGSAPFFDIDVSTGVAHDGYEYDVARVLATRLGLGRVRVVHGSVDAIALGYDCLCDVFLGGVVVTEALARKVDLSVPYVNADPVVLVRAGVPAPTLDTAPALRWAVVAGDLDAVGVLAHRFEAAVPAERLPTAEGVIQQVASGVIDAGLLPAPVALLAVAANPALAVVARFATGASWAAVEPLGSGNSPSLSDVMGSLADDGTLGFINRRHLGVDPSEIPLVAAS